MKQHFLCTPRVCLDQKFVVFGTEMDLEGHMVEAHGAEMSSRDRLYTKAAPIATDPPRALRAVELSLRSNRNSESSARNLISSVWNFLDQNSDTSATIVNSILELLNEEDKKKDLLNAWNDFKVEVRFLHHSRQRLVTERPVVSKAPNSQNSLRAPSVWGTRASPVEGFRTLSTKRLGPHTHDIRSWIVSQLRHQARPGHTHDRNPPATSSHPPQN